MSVSAQGAGSGPPGAGVSSTTLSIATELYWPMLCEVSKMPTVTGSVRLTIAVPIGVHVEPSGENAEVKRLPCRWSLSHSLGELKPASDAGAVTALSEVGLHCMCTPLPTDGVVGASTPEQPSTVQPTPLTLGVLALTVGVVKASINGVPG